MAEFFPALTADHRAFIARQPVFFVATTAEGARINLSPKGMDCFRVLDDRTVAYLDLDFGHHVGAVFGPAINLGLAFLAAKALHLGDGHARHADFGQRLAYLIELERFDNGND